jgi:hypothetical protein
MVMPTQNSFTCRLVLRKKRNFISKLEDDGRIVTNHEQTQEVRMVSFPIFWVLNFRDLLLLIW